jgi:uncharacterized SAM-binding protein YcdF (DUF218 family)
MRAQKTRLRLFFKRLIRLVVIVAFFLTIAGGLGFLGLAWRIDQAAPGDPVHPTDVIVVLGAWVRADGSPGPDLRARTWAAVQLYNTLRATGQNPVLITTGGFENERLSAASVARRKAIEWGVPPQTIWLADGGQTTEEDALFAARLMRANGWQSATLVSHPLHLFRSRWYFERAGVSPVYTYPAGNVDRLPAGARLYLDLREAAAVIWGAVNGWERFGPVGYWLEAVFYHQTRF